MWSNERPNLVFDKDVFEMYVRCRFTEKALGTRPANDDIYREFIASKAPDAISLEQEVASKGPDEVADKGTTVFPVGSFWKTPDDVYYDFNDLFNREQARLDDIKKNGPNKDNAEINWSTDAHGNFITPHRGISAYFDENRKLIPYYITNVPGDRTHLVPGEFVECPFMWNYQMRGSFKEAIKNLQKVTKKQAEEAEVTDANTEAIPDSVVAEQISMPVIVSEATAGQLAAVESGTTGKRKRRTKEEIEADKARKAEEKARKAAEREAKKKAKATKRGGKYAVCSITAYRTHVDGGWFVSPRRIPLIVPETWVDELGKVHDTYIVDKNGVRRLNLFERPLRAETMQGPRVTLASSEMIPAGSEFYFKVKLLNPADKKAFFECMDYKAESGMFQWRSGGMGTLIWTPADENGNPIDVDINSL